MVRGYSVVCRMVANPGALDPKSAPKHTTWTKIWNSWAAQYGTRPGGISVVAVVVWTSAGLLRIPTQHAPQSIPTATPSAMQSCKAADLQTCSMLPWRTPCTLEQRVVGQLPPCYPKTWHKTRRLGPRTCSLLAFSSTKQQTALTVPCPCGCWVPAGLPQWNSLGSRSWSDSPGWTSSK